MMVYRVKMCAGLALALLFCVCETGPAEPNVDLTITSPSAGVKVLAADTIEVHWNRALDDYSVFWRRDGDTSAQDDNWREDSLGAAAPDGFRFAVPAIYSDTVSLKLVDNVTGEQACIIWRLRHFILTEYPPAGARYAVGDSITIAWRISPLLSAALIELLYDNGRHSTPVNTDDAVRVPDTSYTWVIGQESDFHALYPAADCALKVTAYDDEDYYDIMDHTFDIDK
jgi:hypothetical protein